MARSMAALRPRSDLQLQLGGPIRRLADCVPTGHRRAQRRGRHPTSTQLLREGPASAVVWLAKHLVAGYRACLRVHAGRPLPRTERRDSPRSRPGLPRQRVPQFENATSDLPWRSSNRRDNDYDVVCSIGKLANMSLAAFVGRKVVLRLPRSPRAETPAGSRLRRRGGVPRDPTRVRHVRRHRAGFRRTVTPSRVPAAARCGRVRRPGSASPSRASG